jgi:hypothetical protein
MVAITRKETPPGSFPPIHNFQLYLHTSRFSIHIINTMFDIEDIEAEICRDDPAAHPG